MRIIFNVASVLIMIGLLLPPCEAAGGSGHDAMLKKAYELQSQHKETEALTLYEQIISVDSINFEALYQASLLHSRMGERYADDSRKMEHFKAAKTYAMRAFHLDTVDARSNYAVALSLTSLATISGPKQRLVLIHQVKTYLDNALLSDSSHADAWHLLGRWYFKMANLNFAELAASRMIFGGAVRKASNQEAVHAMEMAIQYNPNNLRYYYDLACIYQEMKNKESCALTLQRALALNLDLQTKEELELSRRCRILLEDQKK